MIGVSMRVTPNEKGVDLIFTMVFTMVVNYLNLQAHYRWYVTDCF